MSSAIYVVCGAFLLYGVAEAQPLTLPEDDHLREFRQKLIWKAPLAKTALSALFNEVRNSPHEWGRGIDGFAKRAGSAFGQRAVKATVELGVSGWTHEDLHYHRAGQGRFWPRVKHAMVSTFWVRRDNGEGNTLAVGPYHGSVCRRHRCRVPGCPTGSPPSAPARRVLAPRSVWMWGPICSSSFGPISP